MSKRKTLEEFVSKAKEIHGNKYDYSRVDYKNNHTKVCVVCPKHGEFWQKPNDHLDGHGCSACSKTKKLTNEEFAARANKVHSNKYDYSKVNYKAALTAVCIVCPRHGEFWQKPNDHLNGHGCPHCQKSKGEEKISDFLISKNINFVHDVSCFDWLVSNKGRKMQPDFYLPDYNLVIEYDGEQHFKPIKRWGGEVRFKATVERDELKNQLYFEHNINLLRIPYTDYKNIEVILEGALFSSR